MLLRSLLIVLIVSGAASAAAGGVSSAPVSPEAGCGVRFPSAPIPPDSGVLAAGAPGCFACPEPLTYQAFDGKTYELVRHAGRHTELLLPASWIDGAGLDAAARRLLVERADFVYRHATELMGREPAGAGRLQIAIVDTTCGYGCGNVGAKGIEVVSSAQAQNELRGDLAAGVLPRIVVHEMAHNFDLPNDDLWLGAGSTFDSHAWTSFFEQYLQIYTRMGSTTAAPDDVQRSWLASTLDVYLRDPLSSWQRCIAETACGPEPGTANRAFGGVTHRFAQLHGPEAVRGFLSALATLRAGGPAPATLQDRADLHFEAMALGAGSDLACYADAWRWSISPGLRQRLAALPAEPRCADLDGDGASPLLGDCDDDDGARFPGAEERANGQDDDCNGVADDLLVQEGGSDFVARELPLPVRVEGSIAAGDADDFWIDLDQARTLGFELCSRGFQGWLLVYDGPRWLGWQYTPAGTCSRKSYALGKGRWRFAVELNTESLPGAYGLSVGPGAPWPDPVAAPEAPAADACRLVLALPAPPSPAASGDGVRFWMAGAGFVDEALRGPAARAAFWPEGALPGSVEFRLQAFQGGAPVSDWTLPRQAAYEPDDPAGCSADRDGDGLPGGRDLCPDAPDPKQEDADGDGVGDACDVCILATDGPLWPDAGGHWQRDSDGDGFGNVCDADLDQSGVVNFSDLARLRQVFFSSAANADFDGDGVVNFKDLAVLKRGLFAAPGPSAASR